MIKLGDDVLIHYVAKIDGHIIDTTKEIEDGQKPIPVTVGNGELRANIDSSLIGLKVGEYLNITVSPIDAFGEYDSTRIIDIDKSAFSEIEDLQVGNILTIENSEGQECNCQVLDINDSQVKIDFNHIYAGKTIEYEIEIVEIM